MSVVAERHGADTTTTGGLADDDSRTPTPTHGSNNTSAFSRLSS